jgi:uncharacterized membrane protein
MSGLRMAVTAAAVLWPLTLGAAVVARQGGDGLGSAGVYLAAGRVCHQQPSRSFSTAAVPWPVCARCSGLYLAAPFGALLAWRRRGRAPDDTGSRDTRYLWVAALPTAVTLIVEWLGIAPVSNLARALTALPLGAAVAFVIVRLLGEPPRPIRYTDRA